MTVIEMAVGDEGSRFNTVVAIALITTLLMVLLLPMAFAAGKETSYSAYEDSSDASQLSDVRTTLGPRGAQIVGDDVESQGYNIANTISTPMLVNDWKKPHLTMLLIPLTELSCILMVYCRLRQPPHPGLIPVYAHLRLRQHK